MGENQELDEIMQLIGESSPEQEQGQESSAEEQESASEAPAEEQAEAEETAEGSEDEGQDQADASQESAEGSESESSESGEAGSEESGEEDELTKLKRQNEKLQEQINKAYSQQPQQEQQSTEESQESGQQADPLEDLKKYSFDSIVESEETFWNFVNDLTQKVQNQTEERMMRKVPQVVQSSAQEQIEMKEKANVFYNENPELAQNKPFVATTVNQVSSEHPDWNLDDVLEEAGNRARDALGLEKQAQKQEKKSNQPSRSPGFAQSGKKSSKRQGDTRSEMEREIDQIINA